MVQQAALAGFLLPFLRVPVAVEDDPLVLLYQLDEELFDRRRKLLPFLEPFLELGRAVIERISDGEVQHDVGERNALVRRHRAELELVAGEGKRAGAIAVAGVARQLGQHVHADVEDATALGGLGAARLLHLLEDVGEHVAEEDRNDRRRRLVGPEAVIVPGAGDRETHQPLELVHRAQHGRTEDEELDVVVRRVARIEQVVPEVVAHAPVQVLAGAVDPGERLLVHQAREAVFRRHPSQHLHRHHLVISGDVGVLEDRGELELAGRDLVVPRLHRHADLVELALDVHHEGEHALGDGAEVVVLHLLALRRAGAEQRAAGVDQVRTAEIELPVDKKVLLLGAAGGVDALGLRPEQSQDADRLLRQ